MRDSVSETQRLLAEIIGSKSTDTLFFLLGALRHPSLLALCSRADERWSSTSPTHSSSSLTRGAFIQSKRL